VARAPGSEQCFHVRLGLLGNEAGVFEYVQERHHVERIEQRAAASGDVGDRAIERPRGAVRAERARMASSHPMTGCPLIDSHSSAVSSPGLLSTWSGMLIFPTSCR
jgi:hypothetical protein